MVACTAVIVSQNTWGARALTRKDVSTQALKIAPNETQQGRNKGALGAAMHVLA